jgi:hypothetical protein
MAGFPKIWFPKIFEARPPKRQCREHDMNLPDQRWPGNGHGERLLISVTQGMN